MEAAAVSFSEDFAHLVQNSELFIEHRHSDIARENALEFVARNSGKEFPVENRDPCVHGALEAREFRLRIRPEPARELHLKFFMRGKIGKRGVDGIGDENEI